MTESDKTVYINIKSAVLNETYTYFKILVTIAPHIAFLAYKVGISPNQITILAIALAIPAAYLNFTGNFILGVIVFHIFFLLDATDGILARGINKKSPLGSYLDDVAHYIFNTIYFFSFAMNLILVKSNFRFGLVVLLFLLLNIIYMAHLDLLFKIHKKNNLVNTIFSHPNKNALDAKFKNLLLMSFNFPNVLIWMTVLIWSMKYLEYYFFYAATLSGLYLVYTIIRAIGSLQVEVT